MTVVLGVEGGGSHSHAVVADESGAVLGAGVNDDSSNWEDVGIGAAGAALRSCVSEALGTAGLGASAIDASAFGLAGIDFPMDEQQLSGIPLAIGLAGPTSLVNDALVALRAGTDRPFGAVVVAGTGSVVAGRNPEGRVFRTLGLGPVFGDWGSASEVSEAGMTVVAEAFLGKGAPTRLTALLCERTESGSVEELLEGAARGRIDVTSFAPLVIQAANAGDGPAEGILSESGERLGANAVHVLRTLGMEEVAFDLVLAGGMFRSGTRALIEAVERIVRPVAPSARFVLLAPPPVVGAVLLALELAGREASPAVRATLAEGVVPALRLSGS